MQNKSIFHIYSYKIRDFNINPNGATIISGQGTHQIQVNFNGNFGEVSVLETNAQGCSGTEVKISVNCNVGIAQFDEFKYSLYPNPTDDLFVLELEGHAEQVAFELFDLKGELIARQHFTNRLEMNIEHLAKGVYVGRMHVNDKNLVVKIVKQ